MFYTQLCFVLFITCVYGSDEVCFSVNRGSDSSYSQDAFCTIGMKDRRIKDEDITASSFYDHRHKPEAGRLDNQLGLRGNAGNIGAWAAKTNKVGEWIQVDLHQVIRITGVITQGRPVNHHQWVDTFKISYGSSTNQLQVIVDDNGTELVFQGNNDKDSYSNNKFPYPVYARYIRLLPQTWNNHISLRMEFLTC